MRYAFIGTRAGLEYVQVTLSAAHVYAPPLAIHNRDGLVIGHVHEDTLRAGVQLETFRMCLERDVSGLAPLGRIDFG